MKKQFKLSILAFTVLGALSTSSFAQNAEAVNPNQTINMGQANPFEKEVTPLLREISLKKSLLELRKVERELEKLDEEALKAQVERENLLNGGDKPNGNAAYAAGPMGGIPLTSTPTPIGGFGQGINAGVPSMPSVLGQGGPSLGVATPEVNANAIKILMIYGFSENLYAKVAAGNQGGFVVTEGDVLPDGRLVKKITPNFIEVQADTNKKSKGKGKTERIFVSYTPAPERVSPALTAPNGSRVTPPDITRQIPPQMPVPILTPVR